MANIAVDATRTESVRTATTDPYTFDYTPTTTPRGIVVCAIHADSSTDHISTMTYGGVSMARAITALDSTTEQGRADIWWLGASVPTGTQTVSADLASATTDDIQFVVFGLNFGGDATDVGLIDTDFFGGNVANPSVVMSYGSKACTTISAFYYGGAAAPTPNANMTNLHTHDFTSQFGSVDMQTTPGTADFTCSYTADDDTGLAIATFGPVARNVTADVLTISPSLPNASLTHRIFADVLTITPSLPNGSIDTGQQVLADVLTITPSLPNASLTHRIFADVLTVVPTLPTADAARQRARVTWLEVAIPNTAAGGAQTVTAVVLTITPSLPNGSLTHRVLGDALTVTPTLPNGSLTHYLTAVVLTATPTLPDGSVQHRVLADVLSITPTLPNARIDHYLFADVLTATPSLPNGSITTGQVVTSDVLSVTPTLPDGSLTHRVLADVLAVTPTLPDGSLTVTQNVTAVVLTVTPTLPNGSITQQILGIPFNVYPTLPNGTVVNSAHTLTAFVLTIVPSLPNASVVHNIGADVLAVTPSLPNGIIRMPTVTGVVLITVPFLPDGHVNAQHAHRSIYWGMRESIQGFSPGSPRDQDVKVGMRSRR